MTSPFLSLLDRLAGLPPRAAHVALDALCDEYSTVELAAAFYDWQHLFARENQRIPQGDWRSWGYCTGRGHGKTRSVVSFALDEIAAGRARRVALVGQSEQKTIEILVTGETGILALCPPWLGASYESSSSRIVFDNGSIATLYTSAEPSGLRGPQHSLAIATEIAAWPVGTAEEAMSNLKLGLRLGYGKLLWDSTPKRRNPLIRERLALAEREPQRHVVIRGATVENAAFLSAGVVADWEREIGGTARGREELLGEFLDETENALFRQSHIDRARRPAPDKFRRRIISIDPAISDRRGSDSTGIVELGLGVDDQIFVLANRTGKHSAGVWPGLVINDYVRNGCDLIVVETNRGGSTFEELLRHAARERGRDLIVLGPTSTPSTHASAIYLRPIHARGQKSERAEGASALVEKGRVSFVVGELGDIEDRLCLFDGAQGKPDDAVDAFVHGCVELMPARPDFSSMPLPRAFPTKFGERFGAPGAVKSRFEW